MPAVRKQQVAAQVVTIWDNFAQHSAELLAAGVSEEALGELRVAAESVQEAEQAAQRLKINLARATAPYACCTGWFIQPPTMAARYWARMAVVKVTGGHVPSALLGEVLALLAGLLVLRLWGDGRKDQVMQLVATTGALAELLAEEANTCTALDPDKLADDWLALMNIQPDKKKVLASYQAALERLRTSTPKNRKPHRATTRASSSTRHSRRASSA